VAVVFEVMALLWMMASAGKGLVGNKAVMLVWPKAGHGKVWPCRTSVVCSVVGKMKAMLLSVLSRSPDDGCSRCWAPPFMAVALVRLRRCVVQARARNGFHASIRECRALNLTFVYFS
jgi:hypothetical protein